MAVCCIFYVFLAQKTTIGEIFFPPLGINFVSNFFCHVRQKSRVFRLRSTSVSLPCDIVRLNLKTFLKSALAYPVREFIFLNFNHIGFTAVPTAVECHLFLSQLFQHKQQQLVVVTTVRQVLWKRLLKKKKNVFVTTLPLRENRTIITRQSARCSHNDFVRVFPTSFWQLTRCLLAN